MAKYCEVTLKKQAPKNNSEENKNKKPLILKRKIEIKELKESVRLRLSEEGLKALSEAGGIAGYLKANLDKKLSQKLEAIKNKLIAKGVITIKKAEPENSEAPQEETASAE